MNQVNALRATSPLPYGVDTTSARTHLRLLPERADALQRDARSMLPQSGRDGILWLSLVIATSLHLGFVYSQWHLAPKPPVARHLQEIELLAQPIVPKEVPPPKLEPERKPEPPKVVQSHNAPPPAALRTEAATAPVADTMTVAENLTASKTTGPVEAMPTPPPAPPAHVEEPLVEPNGFAGYLNNPPPVYPKAAQRLGMQGRVLLRVHVLANGQVAAVEVKAGSGKSLLDEAAVNAVRGWTFAPAKRGSTPVDAWTQVPIDFRLAS